MRFNVEEDKDYQMRFNVEEDKHVSIVLLRVFKL